MTFIAAFGLDVPFEIFQSELLKFRKCQQECARKQHACAVGCVEQFSSPEEATAGVACVSFCGFVGNLCLDRCQRNFFLNLGFHGEPPTNKDPAGFFKDKIKPFFPATRKVFILAGLLAGAYGGTTMRKAGQLNHVMRHRGQVILIAGAVLLGVERIMKDVLDDPPDDDFNQIFESREFRFQDLAAPLALESDVVLLFLPFVSATLEVLSCMEGIAVSLDRATAALAAGEMDKHFAQMRVSQRYAKACSENLKRTLDARLTVADKIASLDIAEGPIPEEELIVTHADAIAVQDTWKQGEFDEQIRRVIEQVARSQEEANSIVDDLATLELPKEHFGKSISEMLRAPEIIVAENELIRTLDEWEEFYRS